MVAAVDVVSFCLFVCFAGGWLGVGWGGGGGDRALGAALART